MSNFFERNILNEMVDPASIKVAELEKIEADLLQQIQLQQEAILADKKSHAAIEERIKQIDQTLNNTQEFSFSGHEIELLEKKKKQFQDALQPEAFKERHAEASRALKQLETALGKVQETLIVLKSVSPH